MGYRRAYHRLREDGWEVNRKRELYGSRPASLITRLSPAHEPWTTSCPPAPCAPARTAATTRRLVLIAVLGEPRDLVVRLGLQ